jgi:hypothetical protein
MIRVKNVTFGGLSIVKLLGNTPGNFTFDIEDWGLVASQITSSEDWGFVMDPFTSAEDFFANGGFSNTGDPSNPTDPEDPDDPGGSPVPATYNRPTGTVANPFTYALLFSGQAFTADQIVNWAWTINSTTGSGATLRVVSTATGNDVSSPYQGNGVSFSITGVGPTDFEDKRFSITLIATDSLGISVAWNFVIRFQNVG